MSRLRTLPAILLLLPACQRPAAHPASQPAAAAPGELNARPLYRFTESELDAYLKYLSAAEPDLPRRVVHLARRNIGQPYKLGLLGEGGREPYDPDPLYCLSAGDCVTFVEHTYAMALARDWSSFHETLQRIRYKDGRIGFATRNHFTEVDWNPNNAWLFDDITRTLPGVAPMQVRVDRAAFFRQRGLNLDVPPEDYRSYHIPRNRLAEVLPLLRDADVVEVVRGDDESQFISHMGLFVRDPAGVAMLLHSAEPAVREEPLLEYVARSPKILGLKFLRPRSAIPNG